MRAVIQRVKSASVDVLDGDKQGRTGEIGAGVAVLLAVANGDTEDDARWLVSKIASLRIFPDAEDRMNVSLAEAGLEALVVSQFTLYGSVRKGSRPSFNRSAKPEISEPLYEKFCELLGAEISKPIPRGVFGAYMALSIVNDGPVTIIIDTQNKDL